jgi:hypothetical protein
MARVNVYEAHDNGYGDAEYTLAGWFRSERAERYSDADHNGNGSGGTGRGQAVYRTAQGRWVLERWTRWQGEEDHLEYIDAETARSWLLKNDFDEAIEEHFGEIADEQGPGRPEIGPAFSVRFPAGLLARVDEQAKAEGRSRAELLRDAAVRYLNDGGVLRSD